MQGKECNMMSFARRAIIAATIATVGYPTAAGASALRVWPSAVVAGDTVTLGDICDLSALSAVVRDELAAVRVTDAPPPGGSTIVSSSDIQAALRRGGANLATIAITGATRTAVTRPRAIPTRKPSAQTQRTGANTLRDAVRKTFERQTSNLGGTVDLQFGRTSPQTLELSEPEYTFSVRIRGGRRIGRMIPVEVDVHHNGEKVQTVRLVASTLLRKQVVVAKRGINLNATVRREDVASEERLYDSTTDMALSSIDAVVGQRAKRFVAADRGIRSRDLESVPLVNRGQLVDVISVAGSIEVRSVAKAASAGALGETVELRVGGRRGQQLMGVVIGHRRVRIGQSADSATSDAPQLALGETHAY